MKKRIIPLIFIILLSNTLVSCQETELIVYVTNYPVEYIVSRLVEDDITVQNISSGRLASRSTINKSHLSRMKETDVLFRIGQLEPYMDLYTNQIQDKGVQIIDLASNSTVGYYNNNVVEQKFIGQDEVNLLETIDCYRQPSYLWMDPMILSSMAKSIAEYITNRVPDLAEKIKQRYELLQQDLIKLDAAYQKLNQTPTLKLVSMTPSFVTWENTYNVTTMPIVLSRFGSLPSDSQLMILLNMIDEEQIHYLIVEPNLPSDIMSLSEEISQNQSLIRIQLHDLFTLNDSDILNNNDYLTIMYQNLETLKVIAESTK